MMAADLSRILPDDPPFAPAAVKVLGHMTGSTLSNEIEDVGKVRKDCGIVGSAPELQVLCPTVLGVVTVFMEPRSSADDGPVVHWRRSQRVASAPRRWPARSPTLEPRLRIDRGDGRPQNGTIAVRFQVLKLPLEAQWMLNVVGIHASQILSSRQGCNFV